MLSENMKTMFDIGFIPLIVLDDAADAVPFGNALVAGGIPIAEVTFRTDACLDTIQAMAQQVPGLIVGAGTVHTAEQAEAAVDAGATFIVTPAFNPSVTAWCVTNHIDILPGTVSPADIEAARGFGLQVCKFFPAEAYGGVKTLKALSGPFKDMKFLPTGGVNRDNMNDYLDLPNVAAVGGSFMTPADMVKNKDWAGITATCKQIIRDRFDFSVCHVGLHVKDQEEAESLGDRFSDLLNLEKQHEGINVFAGDIIEICGHPMIGEHGHIGISTRDIDRAMAYYERRGIKFNPAKIFKNDAGQVRLAFFADVIGGFTMHLSRK